ncbi:phasin family protein [Phenylobacterium sp. LjRoot225]|uniref:phasin family protein n=1 Tax=Phenylobacterium sp. LjRoot225 TaxID=3342285 RepID=UPI003ECD72E8
MATSACLSQAANLTALARGFSREEVPMADVQNLTTSGAPKGGDRPAGAETGRAGAEAGSRSFDESARAAEAVADKTADASRAAAKANTEILRSQFETAEQAVHSSLEAGARSIEGLSQTWTRAFGVGNPNPVLAEQSAQNIQAVSRASSALAKGAQEASRAWFDLTQKTLRMNLEAIGRFAGCRSVQEVANVQSTLLRDNLQQVIESGEVIARTQSSAIQEATRAIQPQVRQKV